MKITRTSLLSGVTRTREIDVIPMQLALWKGGRLIQHAMPNLSNADREFIKTGTTDDEWEKTFPPEE